MNRNLFSVLHKPFISFPMTPPPPRKAKLNKVSAFGWFDVHFSETWPNVARLISSPARFCWRFLLSRFPWPFQWPSSRYSLVVWELCASSHLPQIHPRNIPHNSPQLSAIIRNYEARLTSHRPAAPTGSHPRADPSFAIVRRT